MNKQPLIQQIILGMQKAACPSAYWLSSKLEFPELKFSHHVLQRNNQSVWDHTMLVIDLLEVKNPITLLSGLFHDLGKYIIPSQKQQFDFEFYNSYHAGWSKFQGHDSRSASMARMRLAKWQASSYFIDRVSRIVASHMYDISWGISEKTIRKFVATVGQNNVENWFALRKADSASYSEYSQYKRYIIDPFYDAVKEYLDGLSQGDNSLRSSPNVALGGKDKKDGSISLSIKTANTKERRKNTS